MNKNNFNNEHIYSEERRQATLDYIRLSQDVNEQKKIKILKIIFIFLIVLIIRGIFGPIYIKNIFGYPSSNNRYFDVKVNELSLKNTSYKLIHSFPIVPFFVYLKSTYEDTLLYANEPITGYSEFNNEKIIIDIDSYECYYGKNRIKCRYFKDIKPEKKPIKLKNMEIYRISNGYGQVYKGKFKNDISKYLEKSGLYNITIDCEYNHTKCQINFNIKKINSFIN
ncbi:MAG: hypothetical protein IKX00_04120 [Bacilli bacterium]|nr:hypothetical protein [Bacilli bacterium]